MAVFNSSVLGYWWCKKGESEGSTEVKVSILVMYGRSLGYCKARMSDIFDL